MSPIKIRVYQDWLGEGPERQWPACPPEEYSDIEFRFGGHGKADYVFILNDVRNTVLVNCDPDRVWGFIQEPPSELHAELQIGRPYFSRVYTTDETLPPPRYIQYWSGLKWATGLSYDEMRSANYPEKTMDLSWVTSNLTLLTGHQKRMNFLKDLQLGIPDLALFGRGFKPIARKWDALAPARYSIAFENYSGGIYWSEKITDCFLSYATPIYHGSRDIDRYFPKGSYINIDPEKSGTIEFVKEIISSDFHEINLDALLEARELCLKQYNTLFFLADLAKDHYKRNGEPQITFWQKLTPAHPNPVWKRAIGQLRNLAIEILPRGLTQFARTMKHRLLSRS